MADDELYCISSTAAVNEASKLKNKENKSLQLTKAGAEDLLSRFVQDKWLIRSKYVFLYIFFYSRQLSIERIPRAQLLTFIFFLLIRALIIKQEGSIVIVDEDTSGTSVILEGRIRRADAGVYAVHGDHHKGTTL